MGGVLMSLKAMATTVLGIALALGATTPALASECTHAERTSGQCSGVGAVVTSEGVTVSGTQVTPVLVDRGCHSETLVAGRC